MNLTLHLDAGAKVEFNEAADFFRLMAAAAPLTVTFYKGGSEVARGESVGAGYAEKWANGTFFDRVALTSATAQDVQFVTRLGNTVSFDAPPVGNVSITNTGGAFTQAQATVTNASAQLLAARARRYLLIQNNDASGAIYVTLDGTAATAAKGVKIAPGGALELNGLYLPTGAVLAIGSIASNANIVVVEA
jgi:hypothetical protein